MFSLYCLRKKGKFCTECALLKALYKNYGHCVNKVHESVTNIKLKYRENASWHGDRRHRITKRRNKFNYCELAIISTTEGWTGVPASGVIIFLE